MLKTIFFTSLILVVIFSLFACETTYSVKDDIYIRLDNQTGSEIAELWLGNRAIKSNSYSSTSYQTTFKNIPSNAKSKYKQTKGKFWGYNRGNGLLIDTTRIFLRLRDIDYAIQQSGIQLVDATMQAPYRDETITRPTLPDGKYTLVLARKLGNQKSTDLNIRLVKDD